jgi:hypothetical protein
MEKEHKKARLWTPAHKLLLDWSNWHLSEFNEDEEDPDKIQGCPPAVEEYDLGMARRRDPDALPPRNRFEWVMGLVYRGFAELGKGNTLYALKAATLTGEFDSSLLLLFTQYIRSHIVSSFIFEIFSHLRIREPVCMGHFYGPINNIPISR